MVLASATVERRKKSHGSFIVQQLVGGKNVGGVVGAEAKAGVEWRQRRKQMR